MISESHIGRSYPPTPPYVVSQAKVAEFAAALGDGDNPHYAGPEAVAPPTFAVVLSSAAWGAMFDDHELELSLSRTVHTDQRFAWRRPLRVGDAVTATLTIDKFRARGSSAFITIVVGLDADGERICDATSTLLHTWPAEEGGSMTALEVGSELPSITTRFTRATLVHYAGASTDFNPIHWSERKARELGLPTVIAHGMLTMGTALRVATDYLGDPARVLSYYVRFTKPVTVDDTDDGATVTFSGTVTKVEGDVATIAIQALFGANKVLGAATAEVRL